MKKFLLFIVSILLPIGAFGYDFKVDDIYYNIISSTELTVSVTNSGIKGKSGIISGKHYTGDIVIPDEVEFSGRKLKVIDISTYAFYESNMETIVLPKSLKTISQLAFDNCKKLKQITIPNSVISIGRGAFIDCPSLKKAIIEDSETPLAINANDTFDGIFRLCPLEELYIGRDISVNEKQYLSPFGLEKLNSNRLSVVLGDKVSELCNYIFYGAKNLYNIDIPQNVKSIGRNAFANSSLSKIVIPEGYKEIQPAAFAWCENLRSVEISSQVTVINNGAFFKCSKLNSINFPDGLATIGDGAFQYCGSLTEITLPNALKHIGEIAFDGCSSITKITSKAPIPPAASDNTFSTVIYWNADLIVPSGTNERYKAATGWNNFSKINEDNTIIPTYHIYYYVDNIEYKSYEVAYGANITSETEPTKEGYTFSGWSDIPETMPANDVIVTGTFTINKYKLNYTINGEEYKSYDIEYGSTITSETEPTKEGYTFSGWSDLPETMPAKDVTVTGTFTVNKYKLTYSVDGEEYKSYDIEYGSTITSETEPTKEGYTFSGWSDIPETMPAKDVTVTGTFTVNKYKLTYSVDGEEYKSYDVEYGSTITSETEPTKEGYTFSGWSDLPETMPAKDVTVTGTFTVNKYKLTYSVDGEEYKSYDVEYGSTITSETEPTKEGYTFSGWSDLPETMPAKDVTVTGTFTVNKYKLTYSVDGEEYKSYDIEYGSTITSETEPTKEGYTFSGWSDLPETMPAKDVTVTGTFTVNKYKLTYSVDGEEYKSYDIEYGSTITSETEPTKEGYTFSGWSDLPETMPAKDVTVTGTFTINKYKVTYMIDGEVYQTVEVEYGSTITPPNPSDREGYDFAWGDYPSTMPAEDITINGSYTATDIRAILADESDVKIFTVSGKPLNNLQKGVNILRYKDGRTQKLIIK